MLDHRTQYYSRDLKSSTPPEDDLTWADLYDYEEEFMLYIYLNSDKLALVEIVKFPEEETLYGACWRVTTRREVNTWYDDQLELPHTYDILVKAEAYWEQFGPKLGNYDDTWESKAEAMKELGIVL